MQRLPTGRVGASFQVSADDPDWGSEIDESEGPTHTHTHREPEQGPPWAQARSHAHAPVSAWVDAHACLQSQIDTAGGRLRPFTGMHATLASCDASGNSRSTEYSRPPPPFPSLPGPSTLDYYCTASATTAHRSPFGADLFVSSRSRLAEATPARAAGRPGLGRNLGPRFVAEGPAGPHLKALWPMRHGIPCGTVIPGGTVSHAGSRYAVEGAAGRHANGRRTRHGFHGRAEA